MNGYGISRYIEANLIRLSKNSTNLKKLSIKLTAISLFDFEKNIESLAFIDGKVKGVAPNDDLIIN